MAALLIQRACRSRVLNATFRPLFSPSRTTATLSPLAIDRISPPSSLSARLRPSAILQFAQSKFRNATHHDIAPRHRPARHSGNGGRKPGFIDSLPSGFIFWGIFAANGAVFLLWINADAQFQVSRDRSWFDFMQRNFVVSLRNVQEGRVWTILTSCFSHERLQHVLFNGFSYFFMAPPILALLGNTRFLALYLGGGIISSCSSLFWKHGVKSTDPNWGSYGASGAIYAVISFFACVTPRTTFLIFGIIPCPAWAFVVGVFAYDGYSALTEARLQTDTAGHIGGLLAGIGYYLALRYRVL